MGDVNISSYFLRDPAVSLPTIVLRCGIRVAVERTSCKLSRTFTQFIKLISLRTTTTRIRISGKCMITRTTAIMMIITMIIMKLFRITIQHSFK